MWSPPGSSACPRCLSPASRARDTVTDRPPVDPAAIEPLRIVGVLRPPERGNFATPRNTTQRWYIRDVRAMAAVLKAPAPAPIILFAETSTNPAFKALVPAPLPVEFQPDSIFPLSAGDVASAAVIFADEPAGETAALCRCPTATL